MIALFKHAKNFVCKTQDRPLFNGIYFDGKRAIVTNTNLAVIVNDMPFKKQIIHFKTGAVIQGNFPDVDKVMPKSTEFNTEFTDIDQFIKSLKIGRSLDPKNGYGSICTLEGTNFSAHCEEMNFTSSLTGIVLDKINPKIAFSGKYMYDILIFFKDCGVKVVTIGFNTPTSVFKLTTDKGVIALLTPIRIN